MIENQIYKKALAIIKESQLPGEPEITLDKALEIIKIDQTARIISLLAPCCGAIEEIRNIFKEDISYSLCMTHKRLDEIERTLYDSLTSYKVGAALDAIVQISEAETNDVSD